MNFNLDLMLPYKDEVKAAVNRVIDSRQYIYGPELEAFEREFSPRRHVVGVGNGTDALRIALLAMGVKAGDEVISPAFNVAYTALAVHAIGAKNVFVDVDSESLLLNPALIRAAVTDKTRAIIPVHLYGRVCDMERIAAIANEFNLMVLEDAAQAHGAMFYDQGITHGVGARGYSHAVAYSFYPTKNLGALGEAGAITTRIAAIADAARLLRNAGRTDRYAHVVPGINSCLDEIQAAVLRVKLPYMKERTAARIAAAEYYRAGLPQHVLRKWTYGDVNHLFVIRSGRRNELLEFLKSRGIPSLIHYPIPVPYQPIFAHTAFDSGEWRHAEHAAREVLSLPMHADITREDQDRVIEAVNEFESA